MNTDGTGLKAALQAKGMSYGDLARKLGVTGGAVEHWAECRNRPAPHRKAAIEALLGPVPGLEPGRNYDIKAPKRRARKAAPLQTSATERLQPAPASDPTAALRAELAALEAKLAETEPLRQRADRIRQALAILET